MQDLAYTKTFFFRIYWAKKIKKRIKLPIFQMKSIIKINKETWLYYLDHNRGSVSILKNNVSLKKILFQSLLGPSFQSFWLPDHKKINLIIITGQLKKSKVEKCYNVTKNVSFIINYLRYFCRSLSSFY